jgi:hypothetical protein
MNKRELEQRGNKIAAAIKRNQTNASLKDRAFPGRVLKDERCECGDKVGHIEACEYRKGFK